VQDRRGVFGSNLIEKQMKRKTIRVDNQTRHVTLLDQGWLADNFLTRFKGLMGIQHLAPGEGLLITPANQVHTHFMATAIDVFYVNADNVLIDIEPAMRPWRIGRKRSQARYVLELPSGAAARTGSSIGDQIVLFL
jgi:uncharacterized protein